MYKSAIIIIATLCSCNTAKRANNPIAATVAPTPMSCVVDAQVIEILKPIDNVGNSPCSKYPCVAKVKIADIHTCGSSVSLPINPGDTMEMQFTYTLNDTRKIFPEMKSHYPGLKKGKRFTATIEQRLAPGTDGRFVVNHYTIK